MDETRVKSILAPYSPPLSPSQVNDVAAEIAKASTEELNELKKKLQAPKGSLKKTHRSKSRS